MTRISKQNERRMQSPKKRRPALSSKTGALKDALPNGFKEHTNAVEGETAKSMFVRKVNRAY